MKKEERRKIIRQRINGLILIGLVCALAFLVIGAFSELFTRYIPVTLLAPRSGLQMYAGNLVKMRGIDVGKVNDVHLSPDASSAVIELNLYPDAVEHIPANARVDLFQLTAFGNKFVNFSDPVGPPASPLREGSVVRADEVSVEANQLFATLERVLRSVDPAQVNRTLGALSTTLQGQGDRLGQTLSQTSSYLARLNGELPAIQRDLRQTAQVSNLYAGVAPDLLRSIENLTQTGRTFVDKRLQLDATLGELTGLGNDATALLQENEKPLVTALDLLRPTTRLLARYSPMFTCWIQGVDEAQRRLSPILGGPGSPPGAITSTNVLPAVDPYRPGIDLPRVTAHSGPNCWGMPNIGAVQNIPKDDPTYPTDTVNSFTNFNTNPLAFQLFGPELFQTPAQASAPTLPGLTGGQGGPAGRTRGGGTSQGGGH